MTKSMFLTILAILVVVAAGYVQAQTPTLPAGWAFDAAGTDAAQFVVAPDGRRWKISEFDAAGEAAKLTAVKNLLASSVGVTITDLSAAQQKALVAALLYQHGAFDKDLRIKPLADWLK